MKKRMSCKGILSLLLCFLMVFSLVPGFALAEGELVLTLEQALEVTVDPEQEVLCSFTPEKDGYYRFYSESDYDLFGNLLDSDKNQIVANDDGDVGENGYDFNLKYNLQAGKTYYLEIGAYQEEQVTFDVFAVQSVGAVSGKVVTPPDNTNLIAGFEYESMNLTGLEVEFTLSDGSTEIWDCDENNVIADMKVICYPVEENENFSMDITCDDALVNVPFTVIENPVKSISYTGEGLCFYENTSGYYDTDLEYFVYYYEMPWEDTIKIEYTDGTSEELELLKHFPYVDYTYDDGQSTAPWVVGTNAITITYLGKETAIPVEIRPCPYKSVTVNSNPTASVIYGDTRYGHLNGDLYYFTPYDLTGISVTFEKTDGTTETFTAEDFDLEEMTLGDYFFDIDFAECNGVGMANAAFYYKGMEIPFQIPVVESPLSKLEVLGIAKFLLYEDAYYPFMDGLQVKLTMKDGTSQTVELNDETLKYEMDMGFNYLVEVGDYTVFIYTEYDENDKEYYAFYCLDLQAEYHDFSFKETREVENAIISDFAPDGDGMVLNITYTNGETDTLHVEKLCESSWYEYCVCMGKTENGIMYYAVYSSYDDEGNLEGYWVEFLGCEVFVPVEAQPDLGDLDGDGKISAKDALQVLRCVVGKVTFTPVQEVAADVDGNGDINAKDALEILKKVVGKPACF